jgi:hyperosmotically inducible protein
MEMKILRQRTNISTKRSDKGLERRMMGRRMLIIVITVLIVGSILYIYLYPQSTVPRAAGEVFQQASDMATTGKVESAFALSKRLSAYELNVETNNGVVTLKGQSPSEIDKELAENVARDTTGVKQVVNQIQVEPGLRPSEASLRESGRIGDLEIKADLRERLSASQELQGKDIQIVVQDRVITMTGQVETNTQKNGAEQLARGVSNVANVINQLTVGNPSAASAETPGIVTKDVELMRQVSFALFTERENFRDVGSIKVEAKDGRVTLSGAVASRAERSLAERVAREVKGANAIVNQLKIGDSV